MTSFEKSAIIGLYRQGVDFVTIGAIYGISGQYASTIVAEYLEKIKKKGG